MMELIKETILKLHNLVSAENNANQDIDRLVKTTLSRIVAYEECNAIKDFTDDDDEAKKIKKEMQKPGVYPTHYRTWVCKCVNNEWVTKGDKVLRVMCGWKEWPKKLTIVAPDCITILGDEPSYRSYKFFWYPSMDKLIGESCMAITIAAIRLSNGVEFVASTGNGVWRLYHGVGF